MPNFFNKYPYTDFHELNLDWVLETIKQLVADWEEYHTSLTGEWNDMQEDWHDVEGAWISLKNYVENYFANLNVQTEINNKLDEMASDGTLDAILLPYFNAYKNDINNIVSGQNNRITVLENRMDTFASLPDGSTAGNAELLDIRVPAAGFNGNNVYDSAGNAVRGQIVELQGITMEMLGYFGNYASANSKGYGDLNDLPTGSIITYGFSDAQMLNTPSQTFSGTVVTFGGYRSIGQFAGQIAFYAQSQQIAIRSRYANWNNWYILGEETTAERIMQLIGYYGNYASANSRGYGDLDNLPIGSVITYGFSDVQLLHTPATTFSGTVVTFGGYKSIGQFAGQIAFYAQSQRIAIRSRYANWNDWYEINDIPSNNSAYKSLKDFVACGDSLTVSLSYQQAGVYANVKSWANYIADDCGSSALIKAQGGLTTAAYLSSTLYTDAVADTRDYAFIFLGTNDANNSVDIATFTQNYSDIITGLLTNHKFVLCISLIDQISPAGRETYNAAIETLCANNSRAFYVDANKYNSMLNGYTNWGHCSAAGYAVLSEMIERAINHTILGNSSYFNYTLDFI